MEEHQYLYKCSNYAANLNNMRLNNKGCDVTIKVEDKELRAHKIVLAANLKYFESMFFNSFQEREQSVITLDSLECLKGTDMEAFVTYAYTGELLLTDSNALSLLEAADYLSEDDIKKVCIEFLKKHLRTEDACGAYMFADAINCHLLKNKARSTILSNFGKCSQSTEYLDLDYEKLIDILSDAKVQPVESQQMFFEGIMRWIVHDVKRQKIHMNDLLGLIDVAKLPADDIIEYLYGKIVENSDEYGTIRDNVICYRNQKIQQKKQRQVLMILDTNYHRKLHFQFYDFIKKKWSPLEKISNFNVNIYPSSAVLNDELYYITENSGVNHLHVFDSMAKQSTTLLSSSILNDAAMCACSRFVFLCGGCEEDDFSSDQVLRYDPQTNLYETLPAMGTKRSKAATIIYQDLLHVLGGFGGSALNSVEKYDPDTKLWTALPPMCKKRRYFGVAVLDGKLYACGGMNNTTSVEVYDPSNNSWQLVASMKKERHGFLVVAHEGKLLAIGGDEEKTVEVYDPSKDQWHVDHEMSSGLQMESPRGGMISAICFTDAE